MGNCEVSLEGCVNHGYSWVSFKSNGRKEIVTLTTEGGEEEMNYTSEKFMLKQRRYRIKVNVNLTTITGWPVENENVAIFICPGHVSICGEGAPWIVKIETKT